LAQGRSVFGDVVGISLLSPCIFRLRLKVGSRWERRNLTAEAKLLYCAFDLLFCDGEDLRKLTLLERKNDSRKSCRATN
jgi:hypothetical protein